MTPVGVILGKASGEMRRLTTGMPGPAGQRAVEIHIENHAAEIEQQRVGRAGRKRESGHSPRCTKKNAAEQSAKRAPACLTALPAALYGGTSTAARDRNRFSGCRRGSVAAPKR